MNPISKSGMTPLTKLLPASWLALRAQLTTRWQTLAPR
jgi:hypothetical protein